MIDLHTHTTYSDGDLIPAELVRRAEVKGFRAVALTDHVGSSEIEWVVPRLVEASCHLSKDGRLKVIPGIELTHCPLEQLAELVGRARELGAKLVVVHGETLAEPVIPGTNRVAIEAGADILAHPGLISDEDVKLAAEVGVCLEITARRGHCLANGHVAAKAREVGAKVVFGSDTHTPDDLLERLQAEQVLLGAGLSQREVAAAFRQAEELAGLR